MSRQRALAARPAAGVWGGRHGLVGSAANPNRACPQVGVVPGAAPRSAPMFSSRSEARRSPLRSALGIEVARRRGNAATGAHGICDPLGRCERRGIGAQVREHVCARARAPAGAGWSARACAGADCAKAAMAGDVRVVSGGLSMLGAGTAPCAPPARCRTCPPAAAHGAGGDGLRRRCREPMWGGATEDLGADETDAAPMPGEMAGQSRPQRHHRRESRCLPSTTSISISAVTPRGRRSSRPWTWSPRPWTWSRTASAITYMQWRPTARRPLRTRQVGSDALRPFRVAWVPRV